MALLLLLPLLVSGFLVCLKDPTIYCRLHRYEGQMLYLQVGRYGIYCFLMAMAITAVVVGAVSHYWGIFCPGWLQPAPPAAGAEAAAAVCFPVNLDFLGALGKVAAGVGISSPDFSQTAAFLVIAGLLTLVMPTLWSWLTVRSIKKELKANDRDEIEMFLLSRSVRHSPICSALVKAFAFKRPVMITMDDRKVYVGHIVDIGAPTEVTGVDQEIALIPSVSGYRDKDTMKVVYTTDYSDDTPMRPISFRQSNIISISPFSDVIHEKFKRADAERAGEDAVKDKAAKDQLAKAITELVAVVQAAQNQVAPAPVQQAKAQGEDGRPVLEAVPNPPAE